MNRPPTVMVFALFTSLATSAAPASSSGPGPRYEFPSHSSPGVALELKETRREKYGKVPYVYYKLSARGFPPGTKLNLYQWVWTVKDGVLAQAGFQVDESGKVLCPEPAGESAGESRQCRAALEETNLVAVGYQRAQVFRTALISADGAQKAFIETIPFPIETEDQGCRLHAERLSETADSWAIVGEGFKAGESVSYVLKGPGNSVKGTAQLNEKGGLAFMISPPDSGILSGSVTVKLEASTCKPVLRFKWGNSAIEFPD